MRADSIKEMDLRLNELLRGMLEATLDPPGSSDSSSTVERFPQGSLRIAGAHLLGVYEAKATMDLVFVCCTKGVPVPPDLETRLLNAFRLHEHVGGMVFFLDHVAMGLIFTSFRGMYATWGV